MKVINLFGGPGTGKSTTAAGLFFLMKRDNMNCELVTEFAKELVWDDHKVDDQISIFAEQYHRLHRLKDKVEYAITDSPLFLSTVYGKSCALQWPHFPHFIEEVYHSFDNINVMLRRVKPYHKEGRYNDEDGAKILDNLILENIKYQGIKMSLHLDIDADETAPNRILTYIKEDV